MAAVKELTRGWGADVVCDFVGFPSVIPEGLQMLKSGGTYLEIGHISPGHKFEFHPASIVWRSHTIVGMIQYEPWAIQRGLTFLEKNQRKYPFTEVISHVYPAGADQRGVPRGGVAGPPAQPAQDQPRRDRALGQVRRPTAAAAAGGTAMAMQGEQIEPWMMDEVKKFIEGEFLESTVDYFPRGNGSAVLFRVEGRPSHTEPRKLLHQLWLDKSFFVRCHGPHLARERARGRRPRDVHEEGRRQDRGAPLKKPSREDRAAPASSTPVRTARPARGAAAKPAPGRVALRPATRADVPTILGLIRGIAEYERLAHEVEATEALPPRARLRAAARSSRRSWPSANGRAVGFALYFFTVLDLHGPARPSTWRTSSSSRRSAAGGIGSQLLTRLAQIAVERKCGRMEWSVLDWNTPARDLYFKLGAKAMEAWTVFRMTPDAFGRLAQEGVPSKPRQ